MELKLEELSYQRDAISAVVRLFDGQPRNTFDMACAEGVLSTFEVFKRQLADIYGFTPACFEYDSKRLNRVTAFVEEQHPQVMVMTLQSFNAEDRILNQTQREDLFFNMAFIDAIADTRPIIIMDEPQARRYGHG